MAKQPSLFQLEGKMHKHFPFSILFCTLRVTNEYKVARLPTLAKVSLETADPVEFLCRKYCEFGLCLFVKT